MRQIRKGIFETNSSSCHSICISKQSPEIKQHVTFYIGEYGWENSVVPAKDYLYTAILSFQDRKELLRKLTDILNAHSISYDFQEPVMSTWNGDEYLENGYIDHVDETRGFVNAVLNDEDMLMRCLFSNSYVVTGNDNSYDEEDECYVALHNTNMNYDYFFKGN